MAELTAHSGGFCENTIKAALISIFIVTMAQITIYNVKGIASSGKPTENDHLTLQFEKLYGAFQGFLAHCFDFMAPNCIDSLSLLSSVSF